MIDVCDVGHCCLGDLKSMSVDDFESLGACRISFVRLCLVDCVAKE